ncbi:hypothetical protein GC173_13490 [bacterium]|nr:hypothetical protein [bacterium]
MTDQPDNLREAAVPAEGDLGAANRLVLRLVPADESNEVPAALLAQTLTGFQGLVHALALQAEGRTGRQRFRVPTEISERFTISCRPPESGSFVIATRINSRIPDMLTPQDAAAMVGSVKEVLGCVVRGDRAGLARILPDSRLRAKALALLRSAIPAPGSGYRLGVSNGTGPEIALDAERLRSVENRGVERASSVAVETVTGRLTTISFEERRVTIFYAPKNRELDCVYSDDIEPMLFENRRDLIQVTGQVVKDEEGHPKKIIEVEAIEELDLSPILLDQVPFRDGLAIRLRERLSLQPALSETEQFMTLEHEALQIDVFAPTRERLWNELLEQVRMLWAEYGGASDEELSAPALQFRETLRAAMEVIPHGTR